MAHIHDFDWDHRREVKGGYIKKFLLYPAFWIDPSNLIPNPLKWRRYKFNRVNLSRIHKAKGVYCFVVEPKVTNFIQTKYLFYIGKTNRTLQKRYSEYLEELEGTRKSRVKVKEMLDTYNGYLYYYFAPIPDKASVNQCEEKLINTFIPHVNVHVNVAKIRREYQYIYE